MSAPYPPQQQASSSADLSGLVDFRFTKNIGPRLIYAILFVITILFALLALLGALATEDSGGIIAALIGVPLGTLVALSLLRIWMELYEATLRTQANTLRIAQLMELQAGGGPFPGRGPVPPPGYGPPPNYGPPPGQPGQQGQHPGQHPGQPGQPGQPGPYGPPPGGQYPYGPA